MVERGINDLQSWIEGVKISTTGDSFTYLLTVLGFEKQPTEADVKERNRTAHPDCGESAEQALWCGPSSV
ncbi:hypothetical protein E4665_17270 [Sporolactobacillus shoreae]|uniref:Uncharacterized protein n=1 Tax=Sporolactobacillus shoreae TaxID=1465501 RepID=A0A4Z0GIW4_9BACL|nr:hypothetical protein [Sporolactobacillus shoreae]TGA95865.1 hypothetical protein E4665_17270 [Sporolactobacillus shoreae]